MRPGDFSPGNPRHGRVRSTAYRKCFNEAGGFLPRKRGRGHVTPPPPSSCFNEAGGFLPRKPTTIMIWVDVPSDSASMRPGDFSPGNIVGELGRQPRAFLDASMRPGDFSPGNRLRLDEGAQRQPVPCFNEAGGFLPRKLVTPAREVYLATGASMRPGDFSPGNTTEPRKSMSKSNELGFNEAGGFLPRKLGWIQGSRCVT